MRSAQKDYLAIAISMIALIVSVFSFTLEIRGLSILTKAVTFNPDTRDYEVEVSFINTGTRPMMIFSPDISATNKAKDQECPIDDITPSMHSTGLPDSIVIEAGAIVDHKYSFTFQSIEKGRWVACIDARVADFSNQVEDVRFKAGAFGIIKENGKWETAGVELNNEPVVLIPRQIVLPDIPGI